MKKYIIEIVVVLLLLIGATMYVVNTINGLIVLDEQVSGSWAQVVNQYKRRTDLVPNLVATVKGYAAHESDTLTAVIEARSKATQVTVSPDMLSNPKAVQSFIDNQSALSSALSRLMVVAEKYPDLKANQNFMALQSQLEGTENRITVARSDYINKVQEFNIRIRRFPTSMVASMFTDMERKATFDIPQEEQKAPVVAF